MTGPIAYARADLAEAVSAVTDLPVLAHVPERLAPPCVVITEGTPLLTLDETATGAVTVALDLNVIAAPIADNAQLIARMDEAVDRIVTGLWPEYAPTVDAYATITGPDTQPYLAAVIHTTTQLTL